MLEDVDLSVSPGWRVGLMGPNGVGKTTLLKVLSGELTPDRGSVEYLPPDALVGHLPQEPERNPAENAREFVERRCGVGPASAELDRATAALGHEYPASDDAADGAAASSDTYNQALERWMGLGGAAFDTRLDVVAAELGLSGRLLDLPMPTLSGGEAARCGLAALLLSRFDVVLLDEPTNDLDADGLRRLDEWVLSVRAPLVVVSHDRTFLRHTVTHVAEIDEFSHQVSMHAGGWDAYLESRATAARHAQERYDTFATKRDSLARRSQQEREWASQGLSKAKRRPVDNDKFVRNFKIDQTEQLAGKAARTKKAMERLEVVEEPRESWRLALNFGQAPRGSSVAARLDGAVVRRDAFTLGPVDLVLSAGERVAIQGANGSGKSTLIDLLTGRLQPDSGVVTRGPSAVVGELVQPRRQLRDGDTLLDSFMAETGLNISETRTLLAKFGLGASDVLRATADLSPGERTRAVLAQLMATDTNVLVLDEPTNHLDLPAIEQLEVALQSFAGALLLVTHDRSLLEQVRLDRVVELVDGRIVRDDPV